MTFGVVSARLALKTDEPSVFAVLGETDEVEDLLGVLFPFVTTRVF